MRQFLRVMILMAAIVLATLTSAAQVDNSQMYKKTIQAALARLSAGDPEAFSGEYSENFTLQYDATGARGEKIETVFATLRAGIPDLTITPTVIIAQEFYVATLLTWSGTFSAPLTLFGQSLTPTQAPVSWTEIDFWFFGPGGIRLNPSFGDRKAMLHELGAIPAEEGAETAGSTDGSGGYQRLSPDELATTFASGMEDRNLSAQNDMIMLGLGADAAAYYADPYVFWDGNTARTIHADAETDATRYLQMIREADPYSGSFPVITVAEGDWTASEVQVLGTFQNETHFGDIALIPNGEDVNWLFAILSRRDAEGRIVEQWIKADSVPLRTIFGLAPSQGD